MGKKYVVPLKEAITGVLHGRAGTFRILIDEETSGAKHFSLLVNTMNAGVTGDEHKHDVEHCWYILSGTGTMYMDGKSFRMEPDMAVFAPAQMLHKIVVDPGQDRLHDLQRRHLSPPIEPGKLRRRHVTEIPIRHLSLLP